MDAQPINVLLVEDSPVIQLQLTHLLNADPQLHVMGTANNGLAAVEYLTTHKPDVVLMDVHMPKMDGFEATRRIMETQPLPIIMCSATTQRDEMDCTFRALAAGAVAFVEKPGGHGLARFDQMVKELLDTVKLMAEVKVVKRWSMGAVPQAKPLALPNVPASAASISLVAIGASTGGPPVIAAILTALPRSLPVTVLIVQHITAGFLEGMVEWLSKATGWPVHLAVHGASALPGHVYLAPDGFHLGIGPSLRLMLSKGPPENGLRPAVSYLFRSVANTCGAHAAGVLLTGMGRDGAAELKLMQAQGAVTIAQDAETSVVHGMPGEAIRLGAATLVLPPPQIAAMLATLVHCPGTPTTDRDCR